MKPLHSYILSPIIATLMAVHFILPPAVWSQGLTSEDIFLAYLRTGQTEDALDAFQELSRENPRDYLAQALSGYLLRSHGSHRRSIEAFLSAAVQGYRQPEAALFVYEAVRDIRSREDAAFLLDRLQPVLNNRDLSSHFEAALQYTCGQLKQRLGLWDEAQVHFEELNFVTHFLYCAPFENAERGGHDRVMGPEENLALNAVYAGKHREVGWRTLPDVEYRDGYLNLHELVSPSQESTTYLLAGIQSTSRQRCRISFGHGGALKAWLNGRLITDVNRYHSPQLDQVNIEERLEEGENTLLIKISSGEKGQYGLLTRIIPEEEDSLTYAFPPGTLLGESILSETKALESGEDMKPEHSQQEISEALKDERARSKERFTVNPDHTPRGDDSAPPHSQQEPIPLQQLRAFAESPSAGVYHHLFYAMLLQRIDVADEHDHSANTMFSQLNQLFSDNPLLIRLLGDSEKQDNRSRMAYQRVLELSPLDRAAFGSLLDYYSRSPYATQAHELYRRWDSSLPGSEEIQLRYAQLLHRKGLSENAVNLLRSLSGTPFAAEARRFLVRYNSSRMTDREQAEQWRLVLEENPTRMDAVAWLQDDALRNGDLERYQTLLKHEGKIEPLSTRGLLKRIGYLQAHGEYERSLFDSQGSLQTVLDRSPDHFEAHKLSAIAYHALGQDEMALEHVSRALEVQPSDPWCLEYQEFLQADDERYATPYLKDWQNIEIPDALDLSRANYVVLRHQEITKVHPNGNSSETVREAVKVLTDTGVQQQQVRGVYYQTGLEEVRITRARIWKPDGTYLDAPRAEHRSTSSAADAANRLYQDYHVAVVRFPGVEKGSVIEFEYEKFHRTGNIYGDYFGDLFYIGDGALEPSVEREYVLITPAAREFYWKQVDPNYPESVQADSTKIARSPIIEESKNERVYRWVSRNLPTVPREPMMPAVTEVIPYIKVSTFQTWDDMTRWYWNLSKDQLKPGTVVKQRLEQIIADYRRKYGLNTEQELSDWDYVKAINEYINTGVRYLGLEFGINGYQPHKVDEICSAGYGDCKDKAALAVAMLDEVGVDANMVIVRTTDRGEIDYELPSLGIFNHAIYYLPDVDGKERWIDGTATFFGADELPSGDAGANSLIVKQGGGHGFKRIPHSKPDDNGGVYTSVLEVKADGGATGYRTASYRGLYNPVVRQTYENKSKAKEIIDRTLVSRYPGAGSSNIEISELEDYSTDESLSYEMTVPELAAKQGDRLLIPSALFPEQMSQRFAQLSKREYDLVLNYPWTRTNIQIYKLPQGAQADLPQDRTITTPYGEYQRTSTFQNGEVKIQESLVFDVIRLPKEQYQEFRDFCRLIDEAQEEKIECRLAP